MCLHQPGNRHLVGHLKCTKSTKINDYTRVCSAASYLNRRTLLSCLTRLIEHSGQLLPSSDSERELRVIYYFCSSFQEFLARGLLRTNTLCDQGFFLVRLQSLQRHVTVVIMVWLPTMAFLYLIWVMACSFSRNVDNLSFLWYLFPRFFIIS